MTSEKEIKEKTEGRGPGTNFLCLLFFAFCLALAVQYIYNIGCKLSGKLVPTHFGCDQKVLLTALLGQYCFMCFT